MVIVPVPFPSLSELITSASRFCGRDSSMISMRLAKRDVHAGEKMRMQLTAPDLKTPIDVDAQVIARTYRPPAMKVRYALPDLTQMEAALAQLYARSTPALPIALDVVTLRQRRCRLSTLSTSGATFDVAGPVALDASVPVNLQLPHQFGHVDLPGEVGWVSPRGPLSRLHVNFKRLALESQERLEDIVFRFRLGDAPWTPRLVAPGL